MRSLWIWDYKRKVARLSLHKLLLNCQFSFLSSGKTDLFFVLRDAYYFIKSMPNFSRCKLASIDATPAHVTNHVTNTNFLSGQKQEKHQVIWIMTDFHTKPDSPASEVTKWRFSHGLVQCLKPLSHALFFLCFAICVKTYGVTYI